MILHSNIMINFIYLLLACVHQCYSQEGLCSDHNVTIVSNLTSDNRLAFIVAWPSTEKIMEVCMWDKHCESNRNREACVYVEFDNDTSITIPPAISPTTATPLAPCKNFTFRFKFFDGSMDLFCVFSSDPFPTMYSPSIADKSERYSWMWPAGAFTGATLLLFAIGGVIYYRRINEKGHKNHPQTLIDNKLYFAEPTLLERHWSGKCSEMHHGDLKEVKKLGEGQFGEVHLCEWKNPGGHPFYIAVKTLKHSESSLSGEELKNELNIFLLVGHHENVVSMVGYNISIKPWIMAMEYADCGDLSNYLRNLRKLYLDRVRTRSYREFPSHILQHKLEEELLLSRQKNLEYSLNHRELGEFGLQIARGMAHLEKCNVVHRDLAARNILMTRNKVLKISDFGLARRGLYCNSRQLLLPVRWMAPEAYMAKNRVHSSKSDVWSFGVVLWEMGTLGAFPYEAIPNEKLAHFIQKGERLSQPDCVSDELYSLMTRCWALEEKIRPSFQEVVMELESIATATNTYIDFDNLPLEYTFPPCETNDLPIDYAL